MATKNMPKTTNTHESGTKHAPCVVLAAFFAFSFLPCLFCCFDGDANLWLGPRLALDSHVLVVQGVKLASAGEPRAVPPLVVQVHSRRCHLDAWLSCCLCRWLSAIFGS